MLEHTHLPSGISVGSEVSPLYASLPAEVVNQLTISKADNEAPTLALMQPQIFVSNPWDGWDKVARPLTVERLDVQSRALVTAKRPRDWSTKNPASLDEAALAKRIAAFERRLTDEELRNEYEFHGALHQHLSKAVRVAFASTNEYVYTKLFMTPQADPWLGLTPLESLSGLPDDGIISLAP
jgi:hypothetical protein